MRALITAEWGDDSRHFVDALRTQDFHEHHILAQNSPLQHNPILYPQGAYVAEKRGNLQHFIDVFRHQRRYLDTLIRAFPLRERLACYEGIQHAEWQAGCADADLSELYPFSTELLRTYKSADLTSADNILEQHQISKVVQGFITSGFAASTDGRVSADTCMSH